MGSVKDLNVLRAASDKKAGRGRFIFSDRYSVFDWGQMPDDISNKGQALSLMTAYFFEKLAEQGIKTHYRGLVEDGEVKKLADLKEPSAEMEVDLVQVIKPDYNLGEYNYSAYKKQPVNCLIPLEIIYRNTLPEHASFRVRVEKGEIDIQEYGLKKLPAPGTPLKQAIFDVSTKLEASDRYISWSEAKEIAGLSTEEVGKITQILADVNNLISQEVAKVGLKNRDGKIELAFDKEREILVVDAVGTLDECRFEYQGFSISKEAIRKHYRNTVWFQELTKIKKEEGPTWREKVKRTPDPLPEELLNLISQLYMACANEITGREWFKNVASFSEITTKLAKYN